MQIKKLFLSLLIVLNVSYVGVVHAIHLRDYNYGSASVLPVFTRRNVQYVVLGREAYGKIGGNVRGTYDDFGGKRDKGEMHPVETATREWWEEAILGDTIGLDLQQTYDYIDLKKRGNKTHHIIAYERGKRTKNVTYIVNFNKYKTKFFNNFYDARNRTQEHHFKEKDSIATVSWSDLHDAISGQVNRGDLVTVCAWVLDPITRFYNKELITLRPFFVAKLRPFFLGQPYKQGLNEKIRFYNE